MNNNTNINISSKIVIKTIAIILGIYFLYLIRDVLVLLFVSFIITSTIEPIVDFFENKKVPRAVSVSIIYLIIFGLIAGAFYLIIPPLVNQLSDFFQNFPNIIQKLSGFFTGIEEYFKRLNLGGDNFIDINEKITNWSSNIFSTTVGVFSGLFSIIVVLSLTFYLSLKKEGTEKAILAVTPAKFSAQAVESAKKIKMKIGKWLQGQLILMFIIFALDYIGLLILGIPYALVLAIIGGLLEIVPYVGPIASAIPAVILGFIISPVKGLLVIPLYVLIQQIESHIVVPQVMKKAVGLDPIIVILALLAGAKLGGILGAILAVPIATIISVLIHEYANKRNA